MGTEATKVEKHCCKGSQTENYNRLYQTTATTASELNVPTGSLITAGFKIEAIFAPQA